MAKREEAAFIDKVVRGELGGSYVLMLGPKVSEGHYNDMRGYEIDLSAGRERGRGRCWSMRSFEVSPSFCRVLARTVLMHLQIMLMELR